MYEWEKSFHMRKLITFVFVVCFCSVNAFAELSYIGFSERDNLDCLAPVSTLDIKNSLSLLISSIMIQEKYQHDYKIEKIKFMLKNHPWFADSNIEKDFYANEFFVWFIDHKRNQVWHFGRKEKIHSLGNLAVLAREIIESDIAIINEVISVVKGVAPLFEGKTPDKAIYEIKAISDYVSNVLSDNETRAGVVDILREIVPLIQAVDWSAFASGSENIKTLYRFITGTVIKKLRDHKAVLQTRLINIGEKQEIYYEPNVKSLKMISLVSSLLVYGGNMDSFDDLKRKELVELIEDSNKKSAEKLKIHIGRITPEEKVINNNMYVRFDIDDVAMGVKIGHDGKVKYMPRKVFMEQEIKDKIEQLKHRYQSLFINHEDVLFDNLFNFMQLSGHIIKKERSVILRYLNKFKKSSKDRLKYVDNWFYGFVKSRDHGFIHALMDLELVLKQIEYAVDVKNNYLLDGKKVVLLRNDQKVNEGEIGVNLENLIYATVLHDVTSILKRENHHLSGAFVARKILRDLKFKESQIHNITGMILKHRGKRYIAAKTFSEQALEKGDTAAAAEIDRLYYKGSDLKQKSIIDENISIPYRLLVGSGVFEHESFTDTQNTDPLTFYMYSLLFRCFKGTGSFTYEGFGPIESLLPDILDKEIKSLKRQIKFDTRWTKDLKDKYISMVDMLFDASKYLLETHTIELMREYDELFPLFKLPPYTDLKEIKTKSDLTKYLIDSKRRKFLSLPKEQRDEVFDKIFKVLSFSEEISGVINRNYENPSKRSMVSPSINFADIEAAMDSVVALSRAA